MKYTRMGTLAILFIFILMISCDKGEAPVAAFSADVTDVFTGAVVTFTDMSTNGPTEWAWNFGDQTASTMAAYLRVIGYDAVSLVFGANGMIHDEMTAGKWNDSFIFDYPIVV